MSINVNPPEPGQPPGNEVDELVASLRPRLDGVAPADDIERLVRETYAAMSPVRVTTYMPILVERRIKDQLRPTPDLDLREGRVRA
jgi:hypothetical protein